MNYFSSKEDVFFSSANLHKKIHLSLALSKKLLIFLREEEGKAEAEGKGKEKGEGREERMEKKRKGKRCSRAAPNPTLGGQKAKSREEGEKRRKKGKEEKEGKGKKGGKKGKPRPRLLDEAIV